MGSLSFGTFSHNLYYATLLIDEIKAESLGEVKRLLEVKQINPNTLVPELGVTPLHFLAGHENEDFSVVVTHLALRNGGDPNVRSEEGLTPVHISAMWGRCRTLKVLLANGGNPYLVDYKLFLDAEEYALKERQWRAYGILSTFAAVDEDVDRFAKFMEKEPHIVLKPRDTSSPREGKAIPERDKDHPSKPKTCVNEDYDWLSKTMDLIPLDEKSINTIKDQRRKTKIYEYPKGECYRNIYSTIGPKLPKRNKPRHEKKREDSEMYVCGYAESSYEARSCSKKSRDAREAPKSVTSDSVDATVQSNRVLCKMSRIFLYMLKKRHMYQRPK